VVKQSLYRWGRFLLGAVFHTQGPVSARFSFPQQASGHFGGGQNLHSRGRFLDRRGRPRMLIGGFGGISVLLPDGTAFAPTIPLLSVVSERPSAKKGSPTCSFPGDVNPLPGMSSPRNVESIIMADSLEQHRQSEAGTFTMDEHHLGHSGTQARSAASQGGRRPRAAQGRRIPGPGGRQRWIPRVLALLVILCLGLAAWVWLQILRVMQ
jgi:hypothetical protein